ncbi:carbon-nitrogen hydrolase family protein [Cryobacterium glaciale]|uniref:Carbon-nitrogen hydrolase family protein n=1 Tax=Cryobacterium glaciale TaxID=1259145 RepID=A0A4R8V4F4_9MICO|nr:carbon-nitrogen hydrolase family protein [Cryobacterium glaciale]TFB77258.1 carbon-nitrogen hydrolase family protein [Cryobacterium glaciale]
MSRPLPLALIQAPAQPDNDLDAFASALELLTKTHSDTALFIYPELHLSTVGDASDGQTADLIQSLAQPLDGPRNDHLASIAGDLGIWLIPGSFYERRSDGRIYNTAAAYSPEGKRVTAYRKMFPWRPTEKVAAGASFVTFDMAGYGRVGLSICYDAWFPETSRHLAWLGAELIVNVVQTATSDREQEITLTRANAIVNQVFVASANAAAPHGLGQSLLVDPQGRVRVHSLTSESRVLTDVIDLDEVLNTRRFGTGGVTRPWAHFSPEDASIEMPFYSGHINPQAWQPSQHSDQRDIH